MAIQKTLLGKSFCCHDIVIIIMKLCSAAAPSIEPATAQHTKQSAKAPTVNKSEVSYSQAQGRVHTLLNECSKEMVT